MIEDNYIQVYYERFLFLNIKHVVHLIYKKKNTLTWDKLQLSSISEVNFLVFLENIFLKSTRILHEQHIYIKKLNCPTFFYLHSDFSFYL